MGDPELGAGALQEQAVAAVLVDAGQNRLGAGVAQDEVVGASGSPAGAGRGAGEHGVLTQGGGGIGPAHGGVDRGRALGRACVLVHAQAEAAEHGCGRVPLLDELEGGARLLGERGQDEVLEVVHHVDDVAQVEEREVFRVQLAEPLLVDQADDARDDVVAGERDRCVSARPPDAAHVIRDEVAHLVDHAGCEAALGLGRAALLLGVGRVGDGVDVHYLAVQGRDRGGRALLLGGLGVELGQHVLKVGAHGVLGHEGGRQHALEDLIHEVLQDVEARAGDADELAHPREELQGVPLDVVAPDVEEPLGGRVEALARLLEEPHQPRAQLARVEHGVHQEVAHGVEGGPGLGADVGPVLPDLLARGVPSAGDEELEGPEAHGDKGREEQGGVDHDDAHGLQHADEDVDAVGRARALVRAGELDQLRIRGRVVRAGLGVDAAVEGLDRVVHPGVVAGLIVGGLVHERAGHARRFPPGDAVGLPDQLAGLGDGAAQAVRRVVDRAERGP